MRLLYSAIVPLLVALPALAETLRVPQAFPTIQQAINVAKPGDSILVEAGRYQEQLQLKPGITLRSAGTDAKGELGLKRAEATIIDGGKRPQQRGVVMAEGSSLDGFTITNVGTYDPVVWNKHYDSHGEELGDDEGATDAEGSHAAVHIAGIGCVVRHCLVHQNGDVGIAVLGPSDSPVIITHCRVYRNLGGGIGIADEAAPLISRNDCYENLRAGIGCRKASPVVTNNRCFKNIRAGIGCREGARPILRENECIHNRRAGIGIRMTGTDPLLEKNKCYENELAGIGVRDGASPIIRANHCRLNKLAGIGVRDGAKPLILGNQIEENHLAGIGVQSKSIAIIQGNHCLNNKLVAIGVVDGATATITDNVMSRKGGQPPIIAVKDGSNATIRENRISGGGVAAILVQGSAMISDNEFGSQDPKQGNAIWLWEKASATIENNTFSGYRSAVSASKAHVRIIGNRVERFQAVALIVRGSLSAAHVYGNLAITTNRQGRVLDLQGAAGLVAENNIQAK